MMNNMASTNTVYIIGGATATGKTAIAIQLAKHLNTFIISADSRQCYREMNIGTAKPSAEQLNEVKHYFINEHSIEENITAADFEKIGLNYLNEIFKKHDNAIVCGGTGLYIKALIDGLDEMPKVNPDVEYSINESYKENGLVWLQEQVKKEDSIFFESGETQNPARLLRALIFKLSTGKSITSFRTSQKKERPFSTIKIYLDLPRKILYERINNRVDEMMKEGLLEEVKSLISYKQIKNLQTVGYSELFEYLDGNYSLKEAVDKIKQHTRNYAKRQITWFKKDKEFIRLDVLDNNLISRILSIK